MPGSTRSPLVPSSLSPPPGAAHVLPSSGGGGGHRSGGGRSLDDSTAAAVAVTTSITSLLACRPRAAYHPDFHRRSWTFTRSTGRWLRPGRGLSPPARSCTDPGARTGAPYLRATGEHHQHPADCAARCAPAPAGECALAWPAL